MSTAENLSNAAEVLKIRDGRDSDLKFMFSAWLNGYAPDSVIYSELRRLHEMGKLPHGAPMDLYRALVTGIIRRWLKPASAKFVVVCDPADDDTLVGFAAVDGPELLYVYVKQPFRRMGVARRLLKQFPLTSYVLKTEQGLRRLRPTAHGLTYRPRETL